MMKRVQFVIIDELENPPYFELVTKYVVQLGVEEDWEDGIILMGPVIYHKMLEERVVQNMIHICYPDARVSLPEVGRETIHVPHVNIKTVGFQFAYAHFVPRHEVWILQKDTIEELDRVAKAAAQRLILAEQHNIAQMKGDLSLPSYIDILRQIEAKVEDDMG